MNGCLGSGMAQAMFVGGEWVSAPTSFDDLDPWSGATYAEVGAADGAHMMAAIEAAAAAFPAWAARSPQEKQAIFMRAGEILKRRSADVVEALVHETGA